VTGNADVRGSDESVQSSIAGRELDDLVGHELRSPG
jgi:hypothetical protein